MPAAIRAAGFGITAAGFCIKVAGFGIRAAGFGIKPAAAGLSRGVVWVVATLGGGNLMFGYKVTNLNYNPAIANLKRWLFCCS